MAELILDKLSKTYRGDICAVKPTDLQVGDAEFIVLVGPSGCGKTTLLRMIAGLETPSSGTLTLDGKVLNHVAPKDRDLAMVFQSYALYPHLTVRQNLEFGLRMRKVPSSVSDEAVQQAAEMLDIVSLLDRRPGQLSGGQRQRVALGRAVVRKPKLFLFDEPLSNLDAQLRTTTRAELLKLQRRLQTTTIYVTHDQLEAMSMADRLIIMKDGVIQQQGPPLELYRRPANRFVASFIGTPPINILPVTLIDGDEIFIENQMLRLPSPSGHIGQFFLGVRPEHFKLTLAGQQSPNTYVTAIIDFLEPLGNEILATCSVGSSCIIVRLDPQQPFANQPENQLTDCLGSQFSVQPGNRRELGPAT